MAAELIPIQESAAFYTPDESVQGCVLRIASLIDRYFPGIAAETKALAPDAFKAAAAEWQVALDSRFEGFKSFKRQIEWFSGRAAFSVLSRRTLGSLHTLGVSDGGAPFIQDSPLQVSITHAGDYAAAAISLDPSWRIGIDMERIRNFPGRESFLKVAFPEDDTIGTKSDEEIMELWTLKEAFLKIIRKGFAENLGQVKILPERFIYRGRPIETLRRRTERFDGHILSFVYGEME